MGGESPPFVDTGGQMQGFGTGVGETGAYLTGIGVPITGSTLQCTGIASFGCVESPSKTLFSNTLSSVRNGDTLASIVVGDTIAEVDLQDREECDA